MSDSIPFGRDDAARWVRVPQAGDDKYSRGVLGVLTGSEEFPGAAVMGVEGAVRTGLGMVRYVGAPRAADFVLQRRPEVVTSDGRVQAWLIGSGMPPERDAALQRRVDSYLGQGVPVVLDAGALDLATGGSGPLVVTPHFGELPAVLKAAGRTATKDQVAAEPERWAREAARAAGVTVLLKGSTTYLADPTGSRFAVTAGPPWLATAGAGDVLGGVLGALVATNAQAIHDDPALLADVAAAAAWIHGEAGRIASAGGPIAALDIAEAVPRVVADLAGGGKGIGDS